MLDAGGACGLFERPKARRSAVVGIGKHRDAADSRHRLNENLLPLAVELRGKNCDAGGVATGLGERTHEALVEHVIGESQDWNACSRTLRGANRRISARQDDIHASFHPGSWPRAASGHATAAPPTSVMKSRRFTRSPRRRWRAVLEECRCRAL